MPGASLYVSRARCATHAPVRRGQVTRTTKGCHTALGIGSVTLVSCSCPISANAGLHQYFAVSITGNFWDQYAVDQALLVLDKCSVRPPRPTLIGSTYFFPSRRQPVYQTVDFRLSHCSEPRVAGEQIGKLPSNKCPQADTQRSAASLNQGTPLGSRVIRIP